MNCPNCHNETRGIKLNGKIFCNFCGEILKSQTEILEESYQGQPKAQEVTNQQASFTNNNGNISMTPEAYRKNETQNSPTLIKPDQSTKNTLNNSNQEAINLSTPTGPDIKDSEPKNQGASLNLLEAEEEILSYLEKKATEPKNTELNLSDQVVIKKNRNRAGMTIINGEPDPISLPELESPKDLELEESAKDQNLIQPEISKETSSNIEERITIEGDTEGRDETKNELNNESGEINYFGAQNLGENNQIVTDTNGTIETPEPTEIELESEKSLDLDIGGEPVEVPEIEIENKTKEKKENELLKEGRYKESQVNSSDLDSIKAPIEVKNDKANPKNKPKSQKTRSKKKKAVVIATVAIFTFLGLLSGLVLYVNGVALDEKAIARRIEEKPQFEFNKMTYIPPGYNLSYQSDSEKNYIEYNFLKFDKSESMIFKATLVDSNFDVFEEVILSAATEYQSFIISDTTIWSLGDNEYVFIINNVLYELNSSDKIPSSELQKILEGIVN